MTYEEAIKQINSLILNSESFSKESDDIWEQDIEALNIAKAALEKQIPKKYEIWNGQDCCPNCKALFGSDETRKHLISWKMDYCKYCGQAIDWSDTE